MSRPAELAALPAAYGDLYEAVERAIGDRGRFGSGRAR